MADRLRIEGLSCQPGQGDGFALGPVDLAVGPGEFVFVAGRSGAGKSLLARCLSGLIPHVFPGRVHGRVVLAGTPLQDLAPWEVSQHLGIVMQDPRAGQFGETVWEEVAFGPENLGLPAAEIARRVDRALEATALAGGGDWPIQTLSLGRRQAVAVAAALAMRPSVLVLDEPTAMLDAASARTLMDHLAVLAAEEGLTVIVLEHRTRYVVPRATRLVVLEEGAVAYDGEPQRAHEPQFCERFGLRLPEPLPRRPSRIAPPHEAAPRVVRARGIAYAYPRSATVFDEVDLDAVAGATTVVTGPNGSGKTTLLKVMAGLNRPQRGRIRYRHPLAESGSPRRGQVAFVGQAPEYVFRYGSVAAEYASWRRGAGTAEGGFLEPLDLAHLADRHPLSLSEGEKRRLTIASALAAGPGLLVLDEPSVGFDGGHLARLFRSLDGYRGGGGAVLLASNDPDVLDRDMPGPAISLSPDRRTHPQHIM